MFKRYRASRSAVIRNIQFNLTIFECDIAFEEQFYKVEINIE